MQLNNNQISKKKSLDNSRYIKRNELIEWIEMNEWNWFLFKMFKKVTGLRKFPQFVKKEVPNPETSNNLNWNYIMRFNIPGNPTVEVSRFLCAKMWNFVFFVRRKITNTCLFAVVFSFFPQEWSYRTKNRRRSGEGSFDQKQKF